MNVFFVSNSTCYYFMDELFGLLKAAGYSDVNLALAYHTGCSLKMHQEWWQEDAQSYQLRVQTQRGLQIKENCSMKEALQTCCWDVISFDNNARSFASGDARISFDNAQPHLKFLLSEIRERFPESKYLWHQVWANEIGYSMAFRLETKQQRDRIYQAKQGVARLMAEEFGLGVVPTGDAWELVRDLEVFRKPTEGLLGSSQTLCTRMGGGKVIDDFSHDGDIGGGQYLNACVWFEVLTGQSCVGNPFRLEYRLNEADVSLSEDKIALLQNAAHKAVENGAKLYATG